MRIAVIADVHANKEALEAVAGDMPDVDGVICAGDVVGYNPWPGFCVEWIRDRDVPTIMGNHDRAVASGEYDGFNDMAAAGVEFARGQLTEADREWLGRLPTERTLFDGRVKVVHGHPANPDRYTRPSEYGPGLLGEEDVLVMGHTHVQHHEQYGDGIVLNPGSVGQPRDRDPGAAYTLLDLDAMTVEHRRVRYDVGAVMDAVEEAGLPRQVGTRLARGQ